MSFSPSLDFAAHLKVGGENLVQAMADWLDDDEEEYGDASYDSESTTGSTWVSWFCSLRGNEFFAEVDDDFLQDDFNLVGLSTLVPYYDYALDVILDVDSPAMFSSEQQTLVDSAAELLYGLIHARWIITSAGLAAMHTKFQEGAFGKCPRALCEGQCTLPCGLSDLPRKSAVLLYCPRCNDVYYPKSVRQAQLDGAFFGTTFPHLLFMTFPAAKPAPPSAVYEPRVFGFKLYRGQFEEDAEACNAKDGRPHDQAVRQLPPPNPDDFESASSASAAAAK